MKQRVLLKGKDGIDLLQRISTLDFNRLVSHHSQPGLILNPQGKIICYFMATLQDSGDQVQIEFDTRFLECLDQFTFGERYQLDHLSPEIRPEDPAEEQRRILARKPKLGYEFVCNGETNPLDVNLDSAIHDQKGCYPGQEVIEKIIAIGSASKKLCLVKCLNANTPSIPLPLELDQGKLTSFQSPFGLAIVRKTHTQPGSILKAGDLDFEVIES